MLQREQEPRVKSKLRPLIYALTGDISTQAMEKINTYPFMGVFEKVGVAETKFILDQIESRKDIYRIKESPPKRIRLKPRPAKSHADVLLSVK